ncbi:MAG: protein kinase [Methylobacter sp.]|uniref:serine/threonine protein kinase n=1 Tax=Methylobacter sp. TaxID=2051955 RepID=UPI0027302AF7|nr:protein kinase [Methylobacter sp.]MDP1665550.1 protein kinase [Methylobacter sp.]
MKFDDIVICRQLAERFIVTRGGGNVGNQLGDGGSAVVFSWDQLDVIRALKVYDPKFFNPEVEGAECHRLELQRRLIDQHCPSIVDTFAVDEEFNTCFVTMEFFPGIELKKVIEKVPDKAIASLIRQLVEAVRFLEKNNLVHRDIKPENILVSSDFTQLKLLDLGVVREISGDEDRVDGTDHGEKRPFIATAQYSSPEYLFRLEPPSIALWKGLTIYQVGGVLHDLVCKKPLFEAAVAADNKYALAMAVMREVPDFSGISSNVSTWAALAARCLTKDSNFRLQLVNWSDFDEHVESAMEKLKRTLTKSATSANHAELNEAQIKKLQISRKKQYDELINELRNKLIKEFSPNLRISDLGNNEGSANLFLKLEAIELGVKLAIEHTWDSGIREEFATVRLAADAALEQEKVNFSGERHAIGEINIDGISQQEFLETLIEAVSNILVKHSELNETGGIVDGDDLVVLTWPILV